MSEEKHWLFYNNKKHVMSSPDSPKEFFQLPQRFGSGHVKQLFSCPFAEIKDTEFTFRDSMCGGTSYLRLRIVLFLCLAGELVLEEKNIIVDTANFLAFSAPDLSRVLFRPNLLHKVVTVEIYPDRLRQFSGDLTALTDHFQAKGPTFFTHKMSAAIKTVIHQLVHCPYEKSLKTLYMEGKLLEFLAVYLHETVYQDELPANCPYLSRYDMKSIYEAKRILDQNFIAPPTIAALAKRICLNEFKLKNGFKQLFGYTVHSYVVNQRLELSKQLFEEKNMNVSEVASYVGYSNVSYFALAFRKKFGISPREYLA
ncbi:MAG TPA: AraC family transcriptional regulator [Selenomonadales bacterium]|nr:AraC family transcriptional regulator [Selenomonadales bacterium]